MRRSANLLGPGEPPPAKLLGAELGSPFLLLGDHAGRRVPSALGGLGLEPWAFERHIAWDIGVAGLGERLSGLLHAPFLSQRYSRLVVDSNRAPDREDLIPLVSDEIAIPGNRALTDADRQARLDEIHAPYHDEIAAALDRSPALVVSLHSFTPSMGGQARPWGFGVLHLGDSPFSRAMLDELRARQDLPVGDNLPYQMDAVDYTVPRHAQARGLDYLELEVRHDLLADPDSQGRIAAFLAEVLPAALRKA